jgi:hypothetical protein
MLLVSTCQVRDPILRFILMKTDDLALHGALVCPCPDRWITTGVHNPAAAREQGSAPLGRGSGALWWSTLLLKPQRPSMRD